MSCQLLIGSTNRLRVPDVVNGADSSPLPLATVTAKLLDVQRNELASLALAYVSGTASDFVGYISDTVPVIEGKPYYVEIKIDGGSNLKKTIRTAVTAVVDSGGC